VNDIYMQQVVSDGQYICWKVVRNYFMLIAM